MKLFLVAFLGLLSFLQVSPSRIWPIVLPPESQSPVIVASLAVFNQTGEISPTTLYVPPASGIFRVTSYVVFTTRAFESTGATVGSLIHWKDEQKSESGGETGMGGSGQPVGYGQNEIVIHAIAGQPIQFSTFHGPSISPFNAYFTVIQE